MALRDEGEKRKRKKREGAGGGGGGGGGGLDRTLRPGKTEEAMASTARIMGT